MQTRFLRIDDDEQTRMDQKSLKQKKEMLKQEFEHLEEIKKYDNLSIVSSNDFKFKAELDRLQAMNSNKRSSLNSLQKSQMTSTSCSQSRVTTSQTNYMNSQYGMRSMNNNHSKLLFQTFSNNLNVRNEEELEAYNQNLKEQQERYDNLILEEQEKTESLRQILAEIEKSKLIMSQRIEELTVLNKMAGKRFGNTQALKFLAAEKNSISRKNLSSIKEELNQMKSMQENYKKNQETIESDLQKVIYVGEENVGQNILKIDEAEQINQRLEGEIEKLEIQESRILKKKQKSRYILTYIDCFEKFEAIFMNHTYPEEQRLVDQYTVDEEKLQNNIQVEVHFESTNASQMQQEFDRNELLNQINQFYNRGEGRVQQILNFMFEKYWHMQQMLNKSSLEHENLLQGKNVLLEEIENLDWEINQLKQKNPNLEIHEQSIVAEDAGLLQLEQQVTTLNIRKMETEEHQDQVIAMKAAKAQGLLLKFQLGLSEFLHRMFQIISAIDNKNKDVKKFKYPGLNQEMSKFEEFTANLYRSHQMHKVQSPIEHADFQPPHINISMIAKMFSDIFPDCSDQSVQAATRYLYIQCKTDQILWFHISIDQLEKFIVSLNFQNLDDFDNQMTSEHINEFRDKLIDVFLQNFYTLLSFSRQIYRKVKDISIDLLSHLKETNPKFDVSKLTRLIAKESQDMKQAKQLIIKRMVEYKTGEANFKRDVSFKLKPKTEEDITQGREEIVQMPQNNQQMLAFPLSMHKQKDEDHYQELDDSALQQIKSFFRNKIKEKHDDKKAQGTPTESTSPEKDKDSEIMQQKKLVINRQERTKSKNKLDQRNQKSIHKDEIEQERELIKQSIAQSVQLMKEEREKKLKPEMKETLNERKMQIKEATDRLYGERNYTVKYLKNMAITNDILSDINQLEHFPTHVEQPQLVSTYVMQRKNLHRNLNKDLTLPTLSYLKPTSAYFSRRNQSSEQIKALDQKRYQEIANGVGYKQKSSATARPKTQQQLSRNPISKQLNAQFNTDWYKKKYSVNQDKKEYDDNGYSGIQIPLPYEDKPKSILVDKIDN